MKLCERIVERRLRGAFTFGTVRFHARGNHYRCNVCFESVDGEVQRRSEGATLCVFVDVEKDYDKMPREEVWYCKRKSGLAEK